MRLLTVFVAGGTRAEPAAARQPESGNRRRQRRNNNGEGWLVVVGKIKGALQQRGPEPGKPLTTNVRATVIARG
jgi:hypothetical protein